MYKHALNRHNYLLNTSPKIHIKLIATSFCESCNLDEVKAPYRPPRVDMDFLKYLYQKPPENLFLHIEAKLLPLLICTQY